MGESKILILLAVGAALAGCVRPPEGAGRAYFEAGSSGQGAYPALLTRPALLRALGGAVREEEEGLDGAEARLRALRARAAALTAPVLTDRERRDLTRN